MARCAAARRQRHTAPDACVHVLSGQHTTTLTHRSVSQRRRSTTPHLERAKHLHLALRGPAAAAGGAREADEAQTAARRGAHEHAEGEAEADEQEREQQEEVPHVLCVGVEDGRPCVHAAGSRVCVYACVPHSIWWGLTAESVKHAQVHPCRVHAAAVALHTRTRAWARTMPAARASPASRSAPCAAARRP